MTAHDHTPPVSPSWVMAVIMLLLSGLLLAYLIHTEDVSGSGPEAQRVPKVNSGDAAVTAMVKTAFSLSKKVSLFPIEVSTLDGIVQLTGTVPSEEVRRYAQWIAEDTRGVESVQNLLVIEPDSILE